MTTATKAATVSGTFLRPGVSKNKRLYTPENIAVAVKGMQDAIASPAGLNISMYTSHGEAYADNALSRIGKVTKATQEKDGSGTFEADIAATSVGKDIAVLAAEDLARELSIRGAWLGATVETDVNGDVCITAPGLTIEGIDFTGRPGVEGAQIDTVTLFESYTPGTADTALTIRESVGDLQVTPFQETVASEAASISEDTIREAVEDAVYAVLEASDPKKPYGDVTYADPGYQADKKKRYPIDTAAHVRAAWAYINKPKNSGKYSSAQASRIKGKIKRAAKKLGIDISEEWTSLRAEFLGTLESYGADLAEAYASVTLDNGDANINISGYGIGTAKLSYVADLFASAAMLALNHIDPDEDGDIDTGDPDESAVAGDLEEAAATIATATPKASVTCSGCNAEMPADFMFCPTCGQPVPNAESSATNPTQEEVIVTTESTATAPAATETSTAAPANVASTEAVAVATGISEADRAAIVADLLTALKPALPTETAEARLERETAEWNAAVEAAAPAPVSFTLEQMQAIADAAAANAIANLPTETAAEAYRRNPTRKGLVVSSATAAVTSESGPTARELAAMPLDQLREASRDIFANAPSIFPTDAASAASVSA